LGTRLDRGNRIRRLTLPVTAGQRALFGCAVASRREGCLSDQREGAKVTFDIVPNRGKESAENLRLK